MNHRVSTKTTHYGNGNQHVIIIYFNQSNFQWNDNSGLTAIAIIFTFQEIQIDSQKTFVFKTTTTTIFFYSYDFVRTNNSCAHWTQCMFFQLQFIYICVYFYLYRKKCVCMNNVYMSEFNRLAVFLIAHKRIVVWFLLWKK